MCVLGVFCSSFGFFPGHKQKTSTLMFRVCDSFVSRFTNRFYWMNLQSVISCSRTTTMTDQCTVIIVNILNWFLWYVQVNIPYIDIHPSFWLVQLRDGYSKEIKFKPYPTCGCGSDVACQFWGIWIMTSIPNINFWGSIIWSHRQFPNQSSSLNFESPNFLFKKTLKKTKPVFSPFLFFCSFLKSQKPKNPSVKQTTKTQPQFRWMVTQNHQSCGDLHPTSLSRPLQVPQPTESHRRWPYLHHKDPTPPTPTHQTGVSFDVDFTGLKNGKRD